MKTTLIFAAALVALLCFAFSMNDVTATTTYGEMTVFGQVANWTKCIDNIPVVDNACVDILLNITSLEVQVVLQVDGHTVIYDTLDTNEICANEASLLELLDLIPALAPYAPIIKKIIDLDKFIPAHIFSICVELTNIDLTSTAFNACAQMNSNIMCFEDKCLYQGTDKFGCFTIPL
eukprot:GEZU01028100.1.p1 GENE.GEZU01028100.1~~GEZU01028100.1.p1  ORF type:complete len:177 (-),score=55.88 GEZU01028100.1:29-559(-)